MKIFRKAMLLMICLGLALPSAHALALCKDSDGSFALTVAVDGACTGPRAGGDDREGAPAEGFGRETGAVGCRGNCTDVILGGGGGAAIPPPAFSWKQNLSRPTCEAVDLVDALGNSTPRVSRGSEFSSSAPIPERPSTCDSVVLRL